MAYGQTGAGKTYTMIGPQGAYQNLEIEDYNDDIPLVFG